ncbi:MAG: alanine--glyoxylate aminotransferase family protein [Deltaproteobacteria bacterium]|nr:alanine--glyoxylate aminotransferase family protein [Deltaproteobacteria bacterium]
MKRYLLAPGPTPLPPEVCEALAKPIIHHRAPVFAELLKGVVVDLKWLMRTENTVITLASSATGAMEGAVSNFLNAGDKALVVIGGKFGERWLELCRIYGVTPVELNVTWGEAVTVEQVRDALKKDATIKALYIQASETSTGVAHPVKEIGLMLKSEFPNILYVVDSVTALGVFDVRTDDWGIDVNVGGSQKALMLPPGLAFASISNKAWEFNKTSKLPRYYFDFKKEAKSHGEGQTAYTPAVSMTVALRAALDIFKRETPEKIYARNDRLARATRAAALALGMELFAPASPTNACTAIKAPAGIDGQDIVKKLRNEYATTIAGGQSQLKGKIFRISHMGYIDDGDILHTLLALEKVLESLGYKFEKGASLKVAAKEM